MRALKSHSPEQAKAMERSARSTLVATLVLLAAAGSASAAEANPASSRATFCDRHFYGRNSGVVMRPADAPPAPCPGVAIRLNIAHSHSIPGRVYNDYGATHGWSPERSSGRWDPSQARD